MNALAQLRTHVEGIDAKIAVENAAIEQLEYDGHYEAARRHYENRDDIVKQGYEDVSFMLSVREPEKLFIVTLISERDLADAPSVYIDRTWEGIRAKLIDEWSFIVGTELAEWGPEEVAAHFEVCGYPIDIIETEIPA